MAFQRRVLAQEKRRGTFQSGSIMLPQNASERAVKATAEIKATELEVPGTVVFQLEAFNQTTKNWDFIAGATWEGGPGAQVPSFTVNAAPHRGKRMRIVMDTTDSEITAGALLDFED